MLMMMVTVMMMMMMMMMMILVIVMKMIMTGHPRGFLHTPTRLLMLVFPLEVFFSRPV